MIWYLGMIIAFILMYREYRGEEKKYLKRNEVIGLIVTTLLSWYTVFIFIVIHLTFDFLSVDKCADMKVCRPVLKWLDTNIGKEKN